MSNLGRELQSIENTSQSLSIGTGLAVFEAVAADELVTLDDTTYELRLSSAGDSEAQWLAGLYREDVDIDAGYRMTRGSFISPLPMRLAQAVVTELYPEVLTHYKRFHSSVIMI